MSFKPLVIPLLAGADVGTSAQAQGSGPGRLTFVQNGVFTKAGSLRGRPPLVPTAPSNQIAPYDAYRDTAGGGVPWRFAGLLDGAPNGTGGQQAIQYHGHLQVQSDQNEWTDAGACWSAKRTTMGAAVRLTNGDTTYGSPMPWHNSPLPSTKAVDWDGALFAYGMAGANTWLSSYNGDAAQALQQTPTSGAGGFGAFDVWATAGGFLYYNGGDGTIRRWYYNEPGTDTAPTIDTTGYDPVLTISQLNIQQIAARVNPDDGLTYLAYVANAGATALKVAKVSGTTLVSSFTVSLPSGAAITSVSVSVRNGLGALAYTYNLSGSGFTVLQMFASAGMTAGTATTVSQASMGAGSTLSRASAVTLSADASKLWLTWQAEPSGAGGRGTVYVFRSDSPSAATLFPTARFDAGGLTWTVTGATGLPSSGLVPMSWDVAFGPVEWAGRVVMGLYCQRWSYNVSVYGASADDTGASTWYVVDITDTYGVNGVPWATSPNPPTWGRPAPPIWGGDALVAAGQIEGSIRAWRPGAVSVGADNSLQFAVIEGVDFSEQPGSGSLPGGLFQNGAFVFVETAVARVVSLTPQAAPNVGLDSRILIGGSVPYEYDGLSCAPAQWNEQPASALVGASASGALPAGSYTFVVVWVRYDSQGRKIRSLPSRTTTVNLSPPGSYEVSWTVPQLNQGGVSRSTTVEVYSSQVNPAAGAPLYKVFSCAVVGSTTNFTVTAQPTGTEEELYTTGDILEDEAAPSDRGLVAVGGRIWAADEYNLYPSHQITTNVSPAWNLEEFVIPVPTQYGRVVGLGTYDTTVVAVCEQGTLVVTGPGYDETGLNGSGWTSPDLAYEIGAGSANTARGVCSAPSGVFWVGPDGLVYNLSRAGSGQCAGRQMLDFAETGVDLVYVPPVSWADSVFDTALASDADPLNPLLAYGSGSVKVLDLAVGQWSFWTFDNTGTSDGPAVWTAASLCNARGYGLGVAIGTPYGAGVSQAQLGAIAPADLGDLGDVNGRPFLTFATACTPASGEGPMLAWGRVRSVSPLFLPIHTYGPGDPRTLRVRVYPGEAQLSTNLVTEDGLQPYYNTPSTDKTVAMADVDVSGYGTAPPTGQTTWPWGAVPEFRTDVQRVGPFGALVTAYPGYTFEFTALELWVSGGADMRPSPYRQ
jgi:hypothetical protein